MDELGLITRKLKFAYFFMLISFVITVAILALWYKDYGVKLHTSHFDTFSFDVEHMSAQATVLYKDGLRQLNFMGYKHTAFNRGQQKYIYSESIQGSLEKDVYKCSTLGYRSIVFKSNGNKKEELLVYCQSL